MSDRPEKIAHYASMIQAAAMMEPADLADLRAWERSHLDGRRVATSDWPRWPEFLVVAPKRLQGYRRRAQRPKATIPPQLRWQVWRRDDFTCQACGIQDDLQIDHVIAESKGGPTTLANLQTFCRSCNGRKGAR